MVRLKFGNSLVIHQTAKLKSPPNKPCIRYVAILLSIASNCNHILMQKVVIFPQGKYNDNTINKHDVVKRQSEENCQCKDGNPGLMGPPGNKGEKGVEGKQGRKGDTGPPGPRGDTGNQGLQGSTGPMGPPGNKGEKGVEGKQGRKGDTGPPGPRDDTGNQGLQGSTGPMGPSGNNGEKWKVNKDIKEILVLQDQ